MDKKDFIVGQKVYLRVIEGSNAARSINKSDPEAWIKEMVVTKIGTKFITVAKDMNAQWEEAKFNIQDNFTHHYTVGGQDYELFLSKEAVQEDMESEELYDSIKHSFSDWKNKKKYSLKQLRKIKEIIG